MVVVRKKVVDGREYFYLQHTVRTSNGIQTREKNLGVKLPRNIEELKRGTSANG